MGSGCALSAAWAAGVRAWARVHACSRLYKKNNNMLQQLWHA